MDILLFLMLTLIILILLGNTENAVILSRLKKFNRRKIIIDSCVLIDGRIVELVRSGFVNDELVIPRFILKELQLLADGKDTLKRERARYGLEIAAELQEYNWAEAKVNDSNFPGVTDDKLIKLAKKINGVLCTTDYNLNRVAAAEGIKALNLNELAQVLRPAALPGEIIDVKILQRGSNADQGVGYLDDGTMVVVDGASKSIGTSVSASVDRMHQSVAGKMIFAHKKNSSKQKLPSQSNQKRISRVNMNESKLRRKKLTKPRRIIQ